jgi:hypothetical protein
MTPVSVALAVVFAAWFGLSVAAHLSPRARGRFIRLEVSGLIPHWNFFAPRPGVHDVHLLYRDVDDHEVIGPLAYVPMIGRRRWFHALWHPDKVRSKVVSDITATIQTICRQTEERDGDLRLVMFTQPYVLALQLAMQMPVDPAAHARQFILARHRTTAEEAEHQLLFFSTFHPFTASDARAAVG